MLHITLFVLKIENLDEKKFLIIDISVTLGLLDPKINSTYY